MKVVEVKLETGTLRLGPLLASVISENKDAIGQVRRAEISPFDMLELTCVLATACAARVNPSVTRADVETLIDMENYGTVFSACLGVSTPEAAPGESPQAMPPSPST